MSYELAQREISPAYVDVFSDFRGRAMIRSTKWSLNSLSESLEC